MDAPNESIRPARDLAMEFLLRFNIAFKIAKVYEPNNRLLLEQVEPLYRVLAIILHAEGEAVFAFRGTVLFFNQVRLEFDSVNYPLLRALISEFTARDIGTLAFSEGVGRDELTRTIVLLAGADTEETGCFENIRRALEPKAFPHVTLEKAIPQDDLLPAELGSAKVYFLGIFMVRDIYEKQRRRATANLNIPRRWIQNLWQHLTDNEPFLFGLTTLKNFQGYTANHGVNTAILSIALGRRLGFSRREISDLGVGALIHDIGTLDVPAALLDKPGRLSESERDSMERQARLGAQRILPLQPGRGVPVKAFEIALEHRLRVDMANLPPNLRKTSIHLFSKIVKIADAYDAMTTKRVFRAAVFPPADALALLRERSGLEFDPLLVKAFTAMLGPHPVGSLVALDSGELAVVVEPNARASQADRPTVKLITNAEGRRIDGPETDLTETDPATKRAKHTILKSLDPNRYGVRVVDYFLRRIRV